MKAEAKTNTDTIKSMKRKSSPEDPEVVIESKPYGPKARRIRVPGSDLAPVWAKDRKRPIPSLYIKQTKINSFLFLPSFSLFLSSFLLYLSSVCLPTYYLSVILNMCATAHPWRPLDSLWRWFLWPCSFRSLNSHHSLDLNAGTISHIPKSTSSSFILLFSLGLQQNVWNQPTLQEEVWLTQVAHALIKVETPS